MRRAAKKPYKAHLVKSPLRQQSLFVPKPLRTLPPIDVLLLLPCRRSALIKALPIGKNAAKTLLAQLRREKVIMYDGGVVVAYEVADVSDWELPIDIGNGKGVE